LSGWAEFDGWAVSHFLDGNGDYGGFGWSDVPPSPCVGSIIIAGSVSPETMFGTIDDLRISNQALFTWETTPFTPELHPSVRPDTVALWNFNEEIGGVITDISGNGHDAVLVNGTLVPDDCHLP
jgi:hypothetical protein